MSRKHRAADGAERSFIRLSLFQRVQHWLMIASFTVLALTTFSQAVTSDMALALAAVSHAYQWLLVTAVGVFYLWREGLSLRTLEKAVESEPATEPEAEPKPATEDVTYVA